MAISESLMPPIMPQRDVAAQEIDRLSDAAMSCTLASGVMGDDTDDDQELDIEDLLDQVATAAEEAKQRRVDFAHGLEHLTSTINTEARSNWPAAATSPLTDDRTAPHLGTDTSPAAFVRAEVNLLMLSSVDHLRALTSAVVGADTYLGGITLARGAFESTVRAQYILAGDSTDDRVQRALSQRYIRLAAADKLARLLDDPTQSDDTDPDEDDPAHRAFRTVAEIEDYATSRGWPIVKGRPGAIGKRATFTDMVGELPGDDGTLGRYLWSSKSALAHGEILESARQWMELLGDPYDDGSDVPVWLLAQGVGGAIVGPWALAATLENYTGAEHNLRPVTVLLLDVWSRTAQLRKE